MRKVKSSQAMLLAASAAGALSMLGANARAGTSYVYSGANTGTVTWSNTANWTPTGDPSVAGDTATINETLAAKLILVYPNISVGAISMGDVGNAQVTELNSLGSGVLTFDNGGAGVTITDSKTGGNGSSTNSDSLYGLMALNDNVTFDIHAGSFMFTHGTITDNGAHTITIATGSIKLDGASNTAALWVVNSGAKLGVSGPNTNNEVVGDILINSGGNLQSFDTLEYGVHDLITLNGNWNMGGGTQTIFGALAGTGAINAGATSVVLDGGTDSVGTPDFSGSFQSTALTLNGGVQRFSGTTAPGSTGLVTVNNGRLELNKTGVAALDSTGLVIAGGEVRFIQSSQLLAATPVTLSGGTLNMNGNNQTLTSPLSLTAASNIDMGTSNVAAVLTFGDSSAQTWTGSADILDWNGLVAGVGPDQLYIGPDDLTPAQLADLTFVNPVGLPAGNYPAAQLPTGEVVPSVPEPASLSLLGLSGLLAVRRRQRRA